MGDDTTGLETMVCFHLYTASRAMTALYRPALEPHGLTYPQYLALCVLWHRGPTTVRDLGHALDLDSGTLSPLVKRLETHGLVHRERGTHDERTVWIHPTSVAARLRHDLTGLPARVARDAGLTLDELTQLHQLLTRVRTTTKGTPSSRSTPPPPPPPATAAADTSAPATASSTSTSPSPRDSAAPAATSPTRNNSSPPATPPASTTPSKPSPAAPNSPSPTPPSPSTSASARTAPAASA